MKSLYPEYTIYGPYRRKQDGRQHMCLVHKITGQRKTISYPKYVVEHELGRHLYVNEVIHHKDGDINNNISENLEVLDRAEHASQHAWKVKAKEMVCFWCGNKFQMSVARMRNWRQNLSKIKTGPFCSRQCSGKYGAAKQKGAA